MSRNEQIARHLVDSGLIKRREAEIAVERAAEERKSLGEILAERGAANERDVFRAIAIHCGLELAEAENLYGAIDAQLLRSVPRRYQERKRVLPVSRHEGTLWVVSCDPDARVVDLVDALACERVVLRLVTPTDFRRLLWAADLGQLAGGAIGPHATEGRDLLATDVRLQPECVGLLDAILADAVGERASDVHLECYSDTVRVRLRVDGDLSDVSHYHLSREQLAGIVNVVKVRARLDIAERRVPQGGRSTARIGGRQFDLRVQTQPTLRGEYVVVRLLPQDRDLYSLDTLGFSPAVIASYRRCLKSPSGLVLVVGPTGCGKSTTLYAALQLLARDPTRKVITVEDPIEYAIEGVVQTQTDARIGSTFAQAVRTFVRQDPDVILVGEIRDSETALEALRASQTGHLVLSTVHSNDAVDAVQRLYDLGMHPNSIAAELLAVFAQRLAKRVCRTCRVPATPEPELLKEVFGASAPADFTCQSAPGCDACRGRGHLGRIAVGEFLPTSRDLRIAIAHHLALDELRATASGAGLCSMRDHALELVREGTIDFRELRSLFSQEMLGE